MDKVFLEIACLTELSRPISGEYLRKKWFKIKDKRLLSQYLQKFIEYNKDNLNFLGVDIWVEGIGHNASLRLKSSKYIGAIPLRSPNTGKQIGDLIVTPRYSSKHNLNI